MSLKQITAIIIIVVTLVMAVLMALIFYGGLNVYWAYTILLVFSIVLYFTVDTVLQRFVFNRLRVIYKIIRSSKRSKATDSKMLEDSELTLESVNKEVVDWASSTSREINQLKDLATYRKDFVGNVSHELKTPIFNAQGFVHTLLDGALYDEKFNRKYLESAADNLDRLENIVDDLEAISSLEAEASIVDLTDFDIIALIKEVVNEKNFASKKSHKIVLGEGTQKVQMVKADKDMIRQVIVNLINNSVKYSDKNGETRINVYDLDRQILTEVSDNGIGIEEKHLKHLFDRFYRVDSGRSRKQGGSGLGLSIVKHILEVHGQTINVRSAVGVGSTFGFTLDKARR
jgi:two-component system phosphate regulon sensor histidine kinase PhoR